MSTRKPQKVIDLVEKAATFYQASGKEIALAEYMNPRGQFALKELYVFALDLNGIMLAHGINEKFAGKNFIDLKDSDGKPFIREIVETAHTQGSGWVEYKWYHPVNKKELLKTVYFKKVEDMIICSGVYKEEEDIMALDLL
jgi:cytochrome c